MKYGIFFNNVNTVNFGDSDSSKESNDKGQSHENRKHSQPSECDLTEDDFVGGGDDWSDDMIFLPVKEKESIVSMYRRCVEACRRYIRKDVDINKLLRIIDMIFSGDSHVGVYKQCTGKSTKRGICIIIGTWLRCGKVFEEGVNAYDLSKCVSSVLEWTDEDTIRMNIHKGDSGQSEVLSKWVKSIMIEILQVGRK